LIFIRIFVHTKTANKNDMKYTLTTGQVIKTAKTSDGETLIKIFTGGIWQCAAFINERGQLESGGFLYRALSTASKQEIKNNIGTF